MIILLYPKFIKLSFYIPYIYLIILYFIKIQLNFISFQ